MTSNTPSKSDARARPKPFTFYPPKNNRLLIGLVKLAIRPLIRSKLRVTQIDVGNSDLDQLRGLKGERCLLMPSHSGGFEPHVIMYLAKLLGDQYNYVAAMELFEQSPINRWLMPRLGVYSVIRGAVDRPSFSMTRQLLASGRRWLVIFPEGQTIWQNSTVIPFQEGVTQLAFKALEDAREGNSAAQLYCIPIAIKYKYLDDMHAEIDASLDRLEQNLSISSTSASSSRYERLRLIGEAVLSANEKAQQLTPAADSDLNTRIQQLKEHVVARLEQQLGVQPSSKQTLLDRIRVLFNTVDRIVYDEAAGSDYEQQLAAERQENAKRLYDDLWRLLQFVAIHDGYVNASMTFERFLDVLGLLEMEVFGRRRVWGPRKAAVAVGPAIDLAEYTSAYQASRRDAIRDATLTLEESVREMLEELGSDCRFVVDDDADRRQRS